MVIDLDPWMQLSNWKWSKKNQSKGVEVIDQCLSQLPSTMAAQVHSPKLTPRKKNINSKYKEFIINKPSGYCPKCRIYVKENDEGVVCNECNAYWHYECANVTQKELDEKWNGVHFQCAEHSHENRKEMITRPKIQNKMIEDQSISVRNIKMRNYELNEKTVLKRKLNALDNQVMITPKDNHRQQVVTMSTPTYHIMYENMSTCGEKMGLEVKRDDMDEKGNKVEGTFHAAIEVNGVKIEFTIICYHTANKMLFQLLGKKSEARINGMTMFINHTLRDGIEMIERTNVHKEVKESMRYELSQMLERPTQYGIGICNESTENDSESSISQESVVQDLKTQKQVDDDNNANKEGSSPNGQEKEDSENTVEDRPQVQTITDELKMKLDEMHKENKKMAREIEQLRKNKKEMDGKEKSIKFLNEKLEKMTKMRDQMAAAVQSLKQEREVSNAQAEVHKQTIESQQATIESYAVIIRKGEAKVTEKEDAIHELEERLKENEIGSNLHKEAAYRFMDEMTCGSDNDSDKDAEEELNVEFKRMYQKMKDEEEKNKMLNTEIDKMKKEQEIMGKEKDQSNEEIKTLKEEIVNLRETQSKSQAESTSIAETMKATAKEIKLTKEALKESEKSKNQYIYEIKMLKRTLEEKALNENVRNATQISIGTNTEHGNEEGLETMLCKRKSQESSVHEELEKIVAAKDKQINDLVSHSQFMDEELADKKRKIEDLQAMNKENEKETLEVNQRLNETAVKLSMAEKEKSVYEKKNIASRQEIAQLVYLNNNLKDSNQQLIQKWDAKAQALADPSHQHSLDDEDANADTNAEHVHDEDSNTEGNLERRWCFSEMRKNGSCKQGATCPFEHDIPPNIDRENILNKSGKSNLCINEFRNEGSCIKGEACRFQHRISEQQRNNPKIKEIMRRKGEMMSSRTSGGRKENNSESQICVYEFEKHGACYRKNACRFNHTITENQRKDPNVKEEVQQRIYKLRENRRKQQDDDTRQKRIAQNELIEQLFNLLERTRF